MTSREPGPPTLGPGGAIFTPPGKTGASGNVTPPAPTENLQGVCAYDPTNRPDSRPRPRRSGRPCPCG